MPPKKKKPTSVSKPLVLLVFILFGTNIATLYYFLILNPSNTQQPIEIMELMKNKEQYIGQALTLAGYLVFAAGNPLLMANPESFLIDFMSSNDYVAISTGVTSVLADLIGLKIGVTGLIHWADESVELLGIQYQTHQELDTTPPRFVGCREELLSADMLVDYSQLVDTDPTKYAVLFSGGGNNLNAHYRYWNNMLYMYFTLIIYGYGPDNIVVLYKDGEGETEVMPVHYPATAASMDIVFANLSAEM